VTSGLAPGSSQPRTITVTGTGRASVQPDLADLRLGVTITAPTVESARSANSSTLAAVIARLKALGIEDRDLQTSIVSVSPQYDYSREGEPPRLAAYTFSNLVAAVVRDIERVGEAIDAALTAGATNVDRIAFRVADQSRAERESSGRGERPRRCRRAPEGRDVRCRGRRQDRRCRRDRRVGHADPVPGAVRRAHGLHGQ
jgi:uncharacterized protein